MDVLIVRGVLLSYQNHSCQVWLAHSASDEWGQWEIPWIAGSFSSFICSIIWMVSIVRSLSKELLISLQYTQYTRSHLLTFWFLKTKNGDILKFPGIIDPPPLIRVAWVSPMKLEFIAPCILRLLYPKKLIVFPFVISFIDTDGSVILRPGNTYEYKFGFELPQG